MSDDDKMPLDALRLAAIHDTAKIQGEARCSGAYGHKPSCQCEPRNPLSGPALEMVAEIRKLRKLAGLNEDGN